VPDILLVGNAVLDLILEVDHFPAEDEEMRARARRSDLGGNAANTARVLAALGHKVSLLASLAPDADGGQIRSLLDQAGVGTPHLVIQPSGSTPVSHILVNAGNGSRTIVHHRDLAELDFDHFLAVAPDDYDWIHFEGRNVEKVAAMMRHLGGVGYPGRVSVEIEKPRPGIEALAGLADLALFSRSYAEAKGFADAPGLLTDRRQLAPRAVMTCTWGAAGAWATDPDGALHHCPASLPSQVVETVGAGDVFNAGMIHALAMGDGAATALEAASRLAGRKVGQRGYAGLALPQPIPAYR
jgi:ketohexokinase